MIPYVDLARAHAPLKAELLAAMAEVIDSGQFVMGPPVAQFEQAFADLCSVPHAVALNSGTDALWLALKALGLGPGDEVITVPNSFVATTAAIALTGARPVLVDVGPDYNLDPAGLDDALSPRTKAILPVHLTGRACRLEQILAFAQAHGLVVIEDAAQAVLAEHRGRRVGSFGAAGCFSLHPLKTLNALGDGGILTTSDAELAARVRRLRNHGLLSRDDTGEWAHNSRLDTLQAAVLLVKLRHLEAWTARRRELAGRYRAGLAEVPQVRTPDDPNDGRAVYHTFVIQAERRDELMAHLAARGIGTRVHYPVPIHLTTAGRDLGYPPGSFPVAEAQAGRILSLPVYPELSDAEVDQVIAAIAEFYGAA